MGIELPAELADIAAKTGAQWPEADEDALREQASAWRRASEELNTLATDADTVAGKALGTMTGPAGDAARASWSGFVDPDRGTLTTAAGDAGRAADRLDHAAEQVGAAKVEMVRQLADAAKNRDAALAAADAGHPAALAGLETTMRGTATNLGAVAGGLAESVGPGGGGQRGLAPDVVPANPGGHGHDGGSHGLFSAATGVPGSVVDSALATGEGAVAGITGDVPGVPGAMPGGAGLAEAPSSPGDGLSAGDRFLRDTLGGVFPEQVDDVRGPEEWAGGQGRPPAAPPLREPLPFVPPDGGTGPIPAVGADLPTPPRGAYGGILPQGGFDDVPTPPSGQVAPGPPGQTTAAGYAGAPAVPPPVPSAPPAGPVPGGFAPPAGGQPFAGGQQFGAAPVGGAAPGPAGQPPPPAGAAQPPRAAPPPAAPGAPPPRAAPAPAAPPPAAVPGRPAPAPEPARQQPPAGGVPVGAPRQERESVVALFLVHMFPIGHLPVASDRPARQLPVPHSEEDFAPWLCFPPHDHPESDVLDPGQALAWLRNGWRQPAPPPAAVLPAPPAELTEPYDSLGGMSEHEWERRYVVYCAERPEYAWPPAARYPEGGCEPGEPVLLEEGTLLDRFGTAHGRVFAPEGTPFAQRSLPPGHLDSGYRRYRVLREMPVWRAVSAAWFGQPGGGERLRSVYSAAELVTLGYLADTTFEAFEERS